jgi:hypothetical protein
MRFGETLIYTTPLPEGAMTFDKTVTKTIGNYTYTSHAFDVWNDWKHIPVSDGQGGYFPLTPFVYSVSYQGGMFGHSILLLSHNSWFNKSGNFDVSLNRPIDSNVKFLIMVQ